jgi:hypothetical protein
MADFKTHLTTSTVMGVAYGGVAHALFDVPLSTSLLAGGLCSVSGMLPDIDSGSGKPLRESLAFAAAVVPMMMVDRFQQLGMQAEMIVLAGAMVYLLVRFGLGAMLRRYTVHRGMFHSLPAAIIFGEVAFLLASGPDVRLRMYKAGAVVIGYISHLMLDEFYSIQWSRGRLRLKKSFGTALKMFSHKWWANASTYLKLGLLTYIVLCEPGWMDQVRQSRPVDWAQNWVQERTQAPGEDPNRQTADSSADDSAPRPIRDFFVGLARDSEEDANRDAPIDPTEPRTAKNGDSSLR